MPAAEVPIFQITADGEVLSADDSTTVLAIRVRQKVNEADRFEIDLANPEGRWSDQDRFREGKTVKIALGYQGQQTEALIEGEVTGWLAEFTGGGGDILTVFGYDKFHRFRRNPKRQSHQQISDSGLAEQIAGELGLQPDVEATQPVHEYIFQNNLTGIDFLRERAFRIGYRVDVEGNKLIFKAAAPGGGEEVELEWGRTLLRFRPRVSTMGSYTEVEVRSWDELRKRPISGKAQPSDLSHQMEAQVSGPQASQETGTILSLITTLPLSSDEEATALAKATLDQGALGFTRGSGLCVGDAKLQVGKTLRIKGCGELYDGPYFVEETRHDFKPSGYRTRFGVMRTGVKQVEGDPPPVPSLPPVLEQAPPPVLPEEEEQQVTCRWSKEKTRSQRPVLLLAGTRGIGAGTAAQFKIYHKDGGRVTGIVGEREGTVDDKGDASASWSYALGGEAGDKFPADFIFKVTVGGKEATSNLLKVRDDINVDIRIGDTDFPMRNVPYVLQGPNGFSLERRLNEDGKDVVPELSPWDYTFSFEQNVPRIEER